MDRQPAVDIAQGMTRRSLLRFALGVEPADGLIGQSAAAVLHPDAEIGSLPVEAELHPHLIVGLDAVFQHIFQKGLQDQPGYGQRSKGFGYRLDFGADPVTKRIN